MSKIKLDKIAYEPHPVSLERKRELNAKGYKIIDIRFKPARDPLDHDGDGKKGGSKAPDGGKEELAALRAEYEAKLGKKPFAGWKADELHKRIEETGE